MAVSIYTEEFESKTRAGEPVPCYFTIKNWKLLETRIRNVAVQVTREWDRSFQAVLRNDSMVALWN